MESHVSKYIACFFALGLLSTGVSAKNNDPILGKWLIVGKETMQERAIVESRKDRKKGTYYFVITDNKKDKIGYKKRCTGCPKPFTDKNLQGMVLIWDLKKSKDSPGKYTGGFGIDPWGVKMFRVQAKVSGKKNNLLYIKGTPLETSLVSRNLVWRRVR